MTRFPENIQEAAITKVTYSGHVGSIPGSGRFHGGGHGKPLKCSYLENPMDRGAWRATVNGVAELDTNEAT